MDTFKIDQDSAVLASLSGVLTSTISVLSDTDKSAEDSKEWGMLEVYQLIVRIVTDKEYKVSKEDMCHIITAFLIVWNYYQKKIHRFYMVRC